MPRTGSHSAAMIVGRSVALLFVALGMAFSSAQAVDRETATIGSNQGVTRVDVEAPRPVWTAVQELVSHYGAIITYEDPPYKYRGDLEDVGAKVSRNVLVRHVFVPMGGKLTVNVRSNNVAGILDQLVQAQSASGTGGRYRLDRSGEFFDVVPTEIRDRNGSWSAITPVLDVPISLPMKNRNYTELIEAICNAVGAAARVRIYRGEGTGGFGLVNPREQYLLGADHERARSVLQRALSMAKAYRGRLTWTLLFDPGSTSDGYFLTILPVPAEARGAALPKSPLTSDILGTAGYFLVGVSRMTGGPATAAERADGVNKATDYCRARSQRMVPLPLETYKGPIIPAAVFNCARDESLPTGAGVVH